MGALTIKNYTFETRVWELKSVVFPNLLTSFPTFLLLYFKNTQLVRILPSNRNDIISNQSRFAYSFFNKFIRKPSFSTVYCLRFLQIVMFCFYSINFVYNIKFNGLLKNDHLFLCSPFIFLTRSLCCQLTAMHSVDMIGDDCAFLLCNVDIQNKYPDLFYFLIKDQFSFTEEENYDEEAIVEKGDRYQTYFRTSNPLFLWFLYQSNTELLVYLIDVLVFRFPYAIYNVLLNKIVLTVKDVRTSFYYLNSFSSPICQEKINACIS